MIDGTYVCARRVGTRARFPRGGADLRGVGEWVWVVDGELDRGVAIVDLVDFGVGDLERRHRRGGCGGDWSGGDAACEKA